VIGYSSAMAATHWQPIGDSDVAWAHERRAKNGWSLRTVASRTGDDGLALFTPSRNLGDAVHGELGELGRPAFLVAPNHFHHLGIGEHQRRYPHAAFVAAEAACDRLERQTGLRPAGLEELESRLADTVTLLRPPALKTGETWLRIDTPRGIAWFVTDAFFHCPETPSGLFGLGCRLTGTTPGLRIGRTFTGLAVADRRAYRRWLLEAIDADRPRILVPAHGDVLEDDNLSDRLTELVERRL
jgi:hypothetical protein